jgi:type II secretory pathway pseudopilin PulG
MSRSLTFAECSVFGWQCSAGVGGGSGGGVECKVQNAKWGAARSRSFRCAVFGSQRRRGAAGGAWRVARGASSVRGFSLVEVTVALGIFAFVAVGILGLLPAALKQRADSSRETRAVMIAGELMSSVQTSPSLTNAVVRVGPDLGNPNASMLYNQNLTQGPVVVGYTASTTVPFCFFQDAGAVWTNAGGNNAEIAASATNSIDTLARLSVTNVLGTPGLYQVRVEVRSPANVALSNSQAVTFATLFYSP